MNDETARGMTEERRLDLTPRTAPGRTLHERDHRYNRIDAENCISGKGQRCHALAPILAIERDAAALPHPATEPATDARAPQPLVDVFHRAYCAPGPGHAMPPCGERADALWTDLRAAALPQPATEPKPWHDGMTLVVHPDGTRCWHRSQPVTEPALLARWPEADLFAALDAEGWFRGMSTADATKATKALFARLNPHLAVIDDSGKPYLEAAQPLAEQHGTICECGLAKSYHGPPTNLADHEYRPRYPAAQPSAEVERLRAALGELVGSMTDRAAFQEWTRRQIDAMDEARAVLAGSDR